MTNDLPDERAPLRQYRVTMTESPREGRVQVLLSWRTFPCIASHWDGHMHASVNWQGGSLRSQDDLRGVLGALAQEAWHTGAVKRWEKPQL